ncbi:MAG: O-antigen ligase family protein [Velocimicrobium sp.]
MSKEVQKKKNKMLWPLLWMAFVPLIMYYHPYDTKLDSYPWFGSAMQVDVFLYYKMVVLIIISVIMLIVTVGYLYTVKNSSASKAKKQEKLKVFYSYKMWIPLIIYAILSMLSTIFSKYSYWGYHGISQQMEPIWVLLGYVMIAYYAYAFIRTLQDLQTVIKWLLISSSIVCLIGTFQTFGYDFYKSTLGKLTFLPSSMINQEIDFVFEKGRAYSSLYNPNYVGVYVTLLLPIIIVLILTNKNRKVFALYIPLLAVFVISLFGSGSKSGLLGIGVAVILLLVLFRKKVVEQWKLTLAGILVIVLAFIGVNALNGNALINSMQTALRTTKSEAPLLSSIETNDNDVTIQYNGNKLKLQYKEEGTTLEDALSLTDESGEKIAVSQVDEATVALVDNRFPNVTVGLANYQDILYLAVTIDGKAWYFTNQSGDNTYHYLTLTGKLDKIRQANASSLFVGRETFASNRGFIWSRTLPLLKKYALLGSGADSFLMVYPNDEYVGKYNFGYGDQNISKPHNLYLQIAVQTGVVSVIALLIFYLMYFVSSIRLFIKSGLDTYDKQMGAAILAGTFGYMLMGISNDSCIAVAPIFWLLLGVGMSINYQIKKKNS